MSIELALELAQHNAVTARLPEAGEFGRIADLLKKISIAEGYSLVPTEPTPAIIEAGLEYAGKGLRRNEAVGRVVTAWRFMLEAAKEAQS